MRVNTRPMRPPAPAIASFIVMGPFLAIGPRDGKGWVTYQYLSSRRKLGGGFTFELQQLLTESLYRSFVCETCALCVFVGLQHCFEVIVTEVCKICFARQEALNALDNHDIGLAGAEAFGSRGLVFGGVVAIAGGLQ